MEKLVRGPLKTARERAGLTQHDLAELIGVSPLYVLDVEVGRRHPTYRRMMKWLEALAPYATSLDIFNQWQPLNPDVYESRRVRGEKLKNWIRERAPKRELERQGPLESARADSD
jgi:transcriptional regulator with XRE-family HTH domain